LRRISKIFSIFMSEMFIYLKTTLSRSFLALYNEYSVKIISALYWMPRISKIFDSIQWRSQLDNWGGGPGNEVVYRLNNIGTWLIECLTSIYILRRFSKIYSIFTSKTTLSLLASLRHRDLRLDSACAFALLKKKSGVPRERSFTQHEKRM
jgi:hypothetical protein